MGLLIASFAVLARCAHWLVDGASALALHLRAPPILIGIVIVGIGTTAPELAVSVTAALQGHAEIALANAVGSVIYDDGIALPLAALLAPAAIAIDRRVLRSAAVFLIAIDLLAYFLAFDGVLGRGEGGILVGGFGLYLLYSYWEQKKNRCRARAEKVEGAGEGGAAKSMGRIGLFFAGGLLGVVLSSEWIVKAAPVVAEGLQVPKVIIGLAIIALGTSIPEVATCVVAARKGQGSLAVGNILGADILNICWVAGASALVNPLVVQRNIIHFMFPAMLIIVLSMLATLRQGYRLTRWKGVILLGMCAVYLLVLFGKNPGALH